MLEHWYRNRRTLVDFRRAPLDPYFDGFAASLKAKGYSYSRAVSVLGICCQFNAFLIEQGITHCRQIAESNAGAFLEAYHRSLVAAGPRYSPKGVARSALNHLFEHLRRRRSEQM